MYNIPSLPATTTTMADLRKAQELFPEGQPLAVIEPFFKLMLDGTYGIRVDNPAEVGDPGSWVGSQFPNAVATYSQAGCCMQQTQRTCVIKGPHAPHRLSDVLRAPR